MGDDRNKRHHGSTAKWLVDTACCVGLTVNLHDMSELMKSTGGRHYFNNVVSCEEYIIFGIFEQLFVENY